MMVDSIATEVRSVESFDSTGVATLEMRERAKSKRMPFQPLFDRFDSMTTLVTPNEGPPWLSKFLQEVTELGSLSDYEATTGVAAPNQVSIRNARSILSVLAKIDLCPSRIGPSSDEGICISFNSRDRYADIESFNSGDIMAASYSANSDTEVWRVCEAEFLRTGRKISRFLGES